MTTLITAVFLAVQSLLVSLPLIYLAKTWALKHDWIDHPQGRKIHLAPVATSGGLGLFAALVVSVLLFRLWGSGLHSYREKSQLILLVLTSVPVVLIGLWDDRKGLSPWSKLIVEILAAALFMGLRVTSGQSWLFQSVPWTETAWSVGLGVCWIVLIVNAINLVDGLDGLAAGLVAISAAWLVLASTPMQNQTLTWIAAMLAGVCAGFLFFNFHPAKIFMGDTGALVLGFWLGAGSAESGFKTLSGLMLAAPLVLLIVPLLEVFSSTLRRMIGGQGIFQADSHHIHHRLLRLGFGHRQIVLFYYAIAVLLGLMGYLLAPAEFDPVTEQPIPRITTSPSMMYGILLGIVGAVMLGYVALAAIEHRFKEAIENIALKHPDSEEDIQSELSELVSDQ